MAVRIRLADTPKLLDEVFKIRHYVFVEEERDIKGTEDHRLTDRFDAYPTTSNLVAITGGQVVGAMRMTLDSSVGLPADEYFNFRQEVPSDCRLLHCGMFCVVRAHRDAKITTGLLLMASYFGVAHKVSHVVAPINPQISPMLQKMGFRVVGEQFVDPHLGSVMQPLILDVRDLHDYFMQFVKQNLLQDFLGDYQRGFYKAGEVVVRAGEAEDEAFVIIDGTAHVTLPGTAKVIGELKVGEVFGELSLLTDEPRSADVVATTDLQVMALSKAVFMERFLRNPQQVLSLLKLMGKRTQTLTQQLDELQRMSYS